MYFVDYFIHLVDKQPQNPTIVKLIKHVKTKLKNADFVTNLIVLLMLLIALRNL